MIMPYRAYTLAGATPTAIAEELRLERDTALAAHPAWSKVTSAYTGNATWTIDVWQNAGVADGFVWFLIVGKHTSLPHCLMGGALEYDPSTNIAKKALRGDSGVGFPDANGYPLVAAGGVEMDFPLSGFYVGTGSNASLKGRLGGLSALQPAPAAGNWCRTLVTDKLAWQGYGPVTSLSFCHGVGTYQQVHSVSQDLKPLAFHTVPAGADMATTVWQHPTATGTYVRSNVQWAASGRYANAAATAMHGIVGTTPDLFFGGAVGSRLLVQRTGSTAKTNSVTTVSTTGQLLGLAPADLLVFNKDVAVAIGDTIDVAGNTYVSVDTPGATPGLFVNTQPAA